jgi:hypothetical protein
MKLKKSAVIAGLVATCLPLSLMAQNRPSYHSSLEATCKQVEQLRSEATSRSSSSIAQSASKLNGSFAVLAAGLKNLETHGEISAEQKMDVINRFQACMSNFQDLYSAGLL